MFGRHPLVRHWLCWLVVMSSATVTAAGEANSPPQPRENLARGKPCRLFPQPTYEHCTDPEDPLQLTDGQTTTAYFWTQRGTVGWQAVRYATVTVDLGRREPISGVSVTTAAGVAGVTWPSAIQVLVSDDGQTFYDAGDLVALDRKQRGAWPSGYAIRRLVTEELAAAGRYVQFVLIPSPGAPYLFTDEVEVFRGSAELLDRTSARSTPVTAQRLVEEGRLQRAVEQRVQADAAALRTLLGEAALEASSRARLLQRVAAVQARPAEAPSADPAFRAVLPLGPRHAELLHVQAAAWKGLGRPALAAWTAAPWDPLEVIAIPPAGSAAPMRVDTMRNEFRAAALNLANSTDHALDVRLRCEGLPESPAPSYIALHEVEWTDTAPGKPVAAALPLARRDGDGWTVTVLPGLVRQVWMTFHVTRQAASEHLGTVVVSATGADPLRLPLQLRIWPHDMPQDKTLWLGGWCYTNNGGSYGITPQNREAFLAHLQEHGVNAPWASSAVMMSFRFDPQDPRKVQLDTQAFDAWLAQWPRAKRYLVFLAVGPGSGQTALGGTVLGSAEFEQRVATWISAWVRHLRGKGIGPERLGLLLHDEPHEASDVRALVAWARAIRAAEPEVVIWEDPTYQDPTKAPAELFDVCNVLCPNRPMWLEHGAPFAQFYRVQQARGRTLQFYSCSGPAKLLDPYSYYRLQAWHAWQVGGTGSFFWAFGDNSGASSWNEYFAAAGPFTPLFLDAASVTPGKQMEAIRESVQDYEYFVLLQQAVERAKRAGRADAVVTNAEALQKSAAEQVLTAAGAGRIQWHETKDRTLADAARIRILESLTALSLP